MENNELDELFKDAAKLVVLNQNASIAFLQRKLKLGFNRVGRIMDSLEEIGIVSEFHSDKPRNVLIKNERELELLFDLKLIK